MKAQKKSLSEFISPSFYLSSTVAISMMVLMACSPSSPYMHGPDATIQSEKVTGGQIQVATPKADILFVIDDSLSMDDHQANVSKNIDGFVDAFKNNHVLDYHMGVTQIFDSEKFGVPYNNRTFTDFTPLGMLCPLKLNKIDLPQVQKDPNKPSVLHNPCDITNILTQPIDPEFATAGKGDTSATCEPADHTKSYVTRSTCNGLEALRRTMKMGTRQGPEFEEVFHPALAVAQNSNLNNGFLRPDATLIVIFVTDANDSTPNMSPGTFYDGLIQAKGGDASKVKIIGAISPTWDTHCEKDPDGNPTRIEELLDLPESRNQPSYKAVSMCSPTFGAQLAAIGNEFSQTIGRVVIPIKNDPDLKSFVVHYGSTQTVKGDAKTGYSYDPADGIVVIGGNVDIQPEPGASFYVTYDDIDPHNKRVTTVGGPTPTAAK